MAASPIDLERPCGIKAMPNYDRSHLESISDDCWLGPDEAPIIPQRVTDYSHIHNAILLGMGLDTLPMQQDIEKLATKTCRAILFRGNDGRLFAGFELPRGDEFRQLLDAVNKDGQEVHILTKGPIPRDPKSNDKKPKFEERNPFPAKILVALPAEVDLPSSCDIFAEVYPRIVGAEELDLRLKFKDETSQTKRHIASFSEHLDETKLQPGEHEANSGYEEHHIREMQKRHQAEGDLFATILSNTIGKLGSYSELIKSSIRALPDGILSIEAFPGAGKTTVTAAIDAFLCLLSEKIKIVVIAAQNAALTGNLSNRLREAVTNINKELSLDSSGHQKQLPLVLRVFVSHHKEIIELVRIVKSWYMCGPDPERPNTLCELLLQLLGAGPHSLPAFSKPGLTELATKIKLEDSEDFQKLRHFIAGDMTWEDANSTMRQDQPSKAAQSALTAQHALEKTVESIFPLVNVLNEEAGATSSPQIFSGWRGIGQPLIISGDSAQFGPYVRDYKKHIFREFLATSTLDMIKTAGYPTFLLNTQHRAIDGQFEPVYEIFYSDFKSIESAPSQHPDDHPDAQRIEEAFVADFAGLELSPADRILPMFIHVPNSACEYIGKSSHSPLQTKAAVYVVKKLASRDIKEADIMETVADVAEPALGPFTVDVGDEWEVRLFAQVHDAIVALKDYQASKSKEPVVKSSIDSDLNQKSDTPSSETEATTKPITLRERLTAFVREAQQPVLKAAANADSSWNGSDDPQMSGEKTSSNPSHRFGTSGENSIKDHGSGESGQLRKDRPKREQITCYNCHEVGHKISDCKKPRQEIDYSKIQCRRCKKFGHTPTKCDQPPPSRGPNSGFGNVNTPGADDSTSNYTGW
ncbi:hypothetical protein INS49_015053 [Diaporthe citri]|uniref:uncharacterized protein n=1 Tax=Diaporthe citri TaxID=83186 RepID=UPI001C7ECA15|nr:uncharacterized protein INS49_015053 [Diaporthe citri]KAG6357175.1 hypothetical protein INS49_015053 [Diaporthe citri]